MASSREIAGKFHWLPAVIENLQVNVWTSVWPICELILGLKGLRLFDKLTSVLCLLGFFLAAVFNLNMRFPEE